MRSAEATPQPCCRTAAVSMVPSIISLRRSSSSASLASGSRALMAAAPALGSAMTSTQPRVVARTKARIASGEASSTFCVVTMPLPYDLRP